MFPILQCRWSITISDLKSETLARRFVLLIMEWAIRIFALFIVFNIIQLLPVSPAKIVASGDPT